MVRLISLGLEAFIAGAFTSALFAVVVQVSMPTPALTQTQISNTSGAHGQASGHAQTKPAPHYSASQMMNMLDQVESNKAPRPPAGGQSQYSNGALAPPHRGGTIGAGARSMPSMRNAMPANFSRGMAPGTSQGMYRMGALHGATGMGALPQGKSGGAGQAQLLGQLKQRFSSMHQGGSSGSQMQMVQQMLQRSGAQPGAIGVSGQKMGQLGATTARLGSGIDLTNSRQQQTPKQSYAPGSPFSHSLGTTGNGTLPSSSSAGAKSPAKGSASMSELEKQMDQQYGR